MPKQSCVQPNCDIEVTTVCKTTVFILLTHWRYYVQFYTMMSSKNVKTTNNLFVFKNISVSAQACSFISIAIALEYTSLEKK